MRKSTALTALLSGSMWRSTLNFIKISHKIWKLWAETH